MIEDPDRPGWVLMTQDEIDKMLEPFKLKHQWKRGVAFFLIGLIGSGVLFHFTLGLW